MEINDSLICSYQPLVNAFRKWKILPLKYYDTFIENPKSRTSTYRLIEGMVKDGFANYVRVRNSNYKIILPSKNLADYLKISVNLEQFDHDRVVSYVAAGFLKTPAFRYSDPVFEHEGDKFNFGLIPDVILSGKSPKTGDEFKLAVEVEISRKSFDKIDKKIIRYIQDNHYDVVIYVFLSQELFDVFKKRLSQNENQNFRDVALSKIALVLVEDYLKFPEKIFESKCFFNSKEGVLGDFF
jgi:hypothetical protein